MKMIDDAVENKKKPGGYGAEYRGSKLNDGYYDRFIQFITLRTWFIECILDVLSGATRNSYYYIIDSGKVGLV